MRLVLSALLLCLLAPSPAQAKDTAAFLSAGMLAGFSGHLNTGVTGALGVEVTLNYVNFGSPTGPLGLFPEDAGAASGCPG